jgi:nickel transport protein
MLRRLKRVAMAVGLILAIGPISASVALAHGTGYRQSEKRPISLEFYYSTGETMSYLEAKVFSPGDEKFAFQSGRTDEDGRFAFTPNAAGRWRVVVRDGEGHLAEAAVDVTDFSSAADDGSFAVTPKAAVPEGVELVVRAALGVSLLFNVAALWSLMRRGKTAGAK